MPRPEKVASRVARMIVEDIVESGRKPGDALEPESLMLERFGISRASLREALRILETQGLITIKPGPRGGPSVAPVSSIDFGRMATLFFQVLHVTLGDVLEARLVIEPVMARMAAVRHDPELNEQLLDNVAAHQDALDDKSWLAVTDSFHAMVCGDEREPASEPRWPRRSRTSTGPGLLLRLPRGEPRSRARDPRRHRRGDHQP